MKTICMILVMLVTLVILIPGNAQADTRADALFFAGAMRCGCDPTSPIITIIRRGPYAQANHPGEAPVRR